MSVIFYSPSDWARMRCLGVHHSRRRRSNLRPSSDSTPGCVRPCAEARTEGDKCSGATDKEDLRKADRQLRIPVLQHEVGPKPGLGRDRSASRTRNTTCPQRDFGTKLADRPRSHFRYPGRQTRRPPTKGATEADDTSTPPASASASVRSTTRKSIDSRFGVSRQQQNRQSGSRVASHSVWVISQGLPQFG